MRRLLEVLLISFVVLGLAACSGIKKKGEEDAAGGDGSSSSEMPLSGDDAQGMLSKRVIYFEFDSSVVQQEYKEVLAAHAENVAAHPDISIVLEGHADERGTREYNIALGERRAKAVQQLLTVQGVAQKQLQVISFGEERPVALGHDESAWSLNRRVELLYSGE